jgi:hypothetical protein
MMQNIYDKQVYFAKSAFLHICSLSFILPLGPIMQNNKFQIIERKYIWRLTFNFQINFSFCGTGLVMSIVVLVSVVVVVY